MSRLTKKETNTLSSYGYRTCEYLLNGTPRVKALNKLGKLEDLEDELGCPLDVVFKAIKNGVDGYLKLVLEYDEKDGWYFDAIWKYNEFGDYSDILPLKNYGKTWWLKGDKNE